MSNTTMINATMINSEVIEARGRSQGMVDDAGFFTQDDWEHELDTLQDASKEALLAHLERSPAGHQTAVFLKGYLMGGGVHFTPFDD